MATRRVLIVSYYWPPSGGGGVQRWLKFAKLLPEHGWQPVVVTPSNPDVPVVDESLTDDVGDEVMVWSFPVWEPTRLLRRLGVGGGASRLGAERRSRSTWVSQFVRWVRGNLFLPDARVGWVRPTAKKVLARLQEDPVDILVTTGPPHSMHLIGLALSRATGLPWVADFRDPWSTMDYLDDFGLTTRSRRKLKAMEKQVVNAADLVLVTSPGALRELGVDPSKGAVVPNGWDRDDFPSTPPERPSRPRPTLGHFGAMYGARNPRELWPVLAHAGWDLLLAGPVTEEVLEDLRRARVSFTVLGDLPHKEAVKNMLECEALLISHNNSESAKSSTPGKFFECLAAGRPLLVVGPENSDLQDRCVDEGLAFFVHGEPSFEQGVRRWLQVTQNEVGHGVGPQKNTSKFERRLLTAELGGLLNATLGR